MVILFSFLTCFFLNQEIANAKNIEVGKQIFFSNCNVCHKNGNNLIIPEKNLKKESLEINGMNNVNAIIYQITNGKNTMPAFGSRLTEQEIEQVANYVLEKSITNFEN
jgi:cytochrome c6